MQNTTYDVVVIGAGPVGENVADRVVRGGRTAAIVERELVGGDCCAVPPHSARPVRCPAPARR
jgi:pyruvate/2-oxoglutarate dehydrogenase complex dihydrolipoamide dehydrogenase (E3) component